MSNLAECAFCGVPVMKFEFKSGPEWHHFVPPETYHYCRFGPTSTRSSEATPVETNRT